MLLLQSQLEKELLGEEPLAMSLKRGRKPGSKVKVLKDGTRVVVTGRAAQALKTKPKPAKAKALRTKVDPSKPKRGPGRPRKVQVQAAPAPAKRPVRRKRSLARPRSGVIG